MVPQSFLSQLQREVNFFLEVTLVSGRVNCSSTLVFSLSPEIKVGTFAIAPSTGQILVTEFVLLLQGMQHPVELRYDVYTYLLFQYKDQDTGVVATEKANLVAIAVNVTKNGIPLKYVYPAIPIDEPSPFVIEVRGFNDSEVTIQYQLTVGPVDNTEVTKIMSSVNPAEIQDAAVLDKVLKIAVNFLSPASSQASGEAAAAKLLDQLQGIESCDPTIDCSSHGVCLPTDDSSPLCLCDAGWNGTKCEWSAASFSVATQLLQSTVGVLNQMNVFNQSFFNIIPTLISASSLNNLGPIDPTLSKGVEIIAQIAGQTSAQTQLSLYTNIDQLWQQTQFEHRHENDAIR